jgi:hypothetical protein
MSNKPTSEVSLQIEPSLLSLVWLSLASLGTGNREWLEDGCELKVE